MRISIDQITDLFSPETRVYVTSLSDNTIRYRVEVDVDVVRTVSAGISKISLDVLPQGGSNVPTPSATSASSPSEMVKKIAASRSNLKMNAASSGPSPVARVQSDPRLALSGKPLSNLSSMIKTGLYKDRKTLIFKPVSSADVRSARTTQVSNESALITTVPDDAVSYGSAAIELAAQGIDVTESLSYKNVIRTSKENIRGLLSRDNQQTRYQPGRLQTAIQQKLQKTSRGFTKLVDLQGSTVAYEVILQTKYNTEIFDFSIDRKDQGVGLGFVLQINALDRKGVVCSSRKLSINHRDKINEYQIPSDIVRISATRISPGFFKVNAMTHDHNIKSCEVYVKSLSEGFEEKFNKLGLIDLVSGAGFRVFSIDSDSGLVFRGIPRLSQSTVYNNASGDAIVSRSLSTATCSLYTYPEANSTRINLEILNTKGNAATINVLRRDLTLNERVFSLLTSLPASSNRITYADSGSRPGHTYEYKCELYDRFQKRVGYSNTRIENIVSPSQEASISTTSAIDAQGNVTLQASVSGNLETSTQKLFSLLNSAGGTPVFQEKFRQIYNSFSSISQLSVERFNTATGETVDLGIFNPGPITDRVAGGSYKYRIEVLTRSPADLLEELATSDSIRLSASSKSPNLQASAQLSQTSQRLNFTQKFVNKFSLTRGTLSYSYTQAQNHPETSIEQGKTGVISVSDVALSAQQPSVFPIEPVVTFDNKVVLRWRVTNASLVDHFVILCERGGSTVICGIAHPGEDQAIQSFVDLTNSNFVGQCRYSMVPIGNGYSTGDRVSLGTIQLKDRSNAN